MKLLSLQGVMATLRIPCLLYTTIHVYAVDMWQRGRATRPLFTIHNLWAV